MKKFLAFSLTAVLITVHMACPVPVKAVDDLFKDNVIAGEISIHCYDTTAYESSLKEVAVLFETMYPMTKVNVNGFSTLPNVRGATYTTDELSKAASDYITRVNVEMMSGGGADIYAIDVLPVYKYADSGQFVDLRGFMDNDPDFDYNDYHKEVFDAAMYRGGQYILPTQYFFDILSYNTKLMDENGRAQFGSIGKYTRSQLFDIAAASFQKHNSAESPIRMLTTPAEYNMFHSELIINFNVFVDFENRQANFTDGKFVGLLNSIKEYGQKGYINSMTPSYMDSLSAEERSVYYSTYNDPEVIYSSASDNWLLQCMIAQEPVVYHEIVPSITKDDEIIGLIANLNGDVPVSIGKKYAMNSNSKNKGTAWEFMKCLISEEIQTSPFTYTSVVNKNAFITNAKTIIYNSLVADRYFYDILPPGEELTESQQAVLDKYLDYMAAFLPLINASGTISDPIIYGMVEAEVKKFFDGVRTADEVAAALQNKVNMYLQE